MAGKIASSSRWRRASVVTVSLLAAGVVFSAPAFAVPTTDPIVGDWNVTYGAPAVVTMTLSGGV